MKLISAIFRIYRRNSKYISDFSNISAQLEIYQRFFKYIGATRNISAIFQIYRRNSKYISDFSNISAQLEIYQRFFKYIDLSTNHDTKKETPSRTGVSFFFIPIIYTKRIFFLHMLHFIYMPRY